MSQEVEEWEEEEDEVGQLEPGSLSDEALTEKYRNSQLRIVRSSVDYSTDQLVLMIRDAQINLSPLYQRRNRWDQRKKSRLIESLLLNIPIPPLFLYEADYGNYEVMDGRQRLEALYDFIAGDLKLKGLEYWTELEGRGYSDLPKVFQMGLRRRTVGGVILLAESDGRIADENDIRMVLFERLNTGGVRLNAQELRNALYQGPFNSLILELSALPEFRRAWDIPIDSESAADHSLYASMGDCDLVLRFFAIREAIMGIRSGSLRHLLDGCARDNQHIPEKHLQGFRKVFVDSLMTALTVFGDTCFRLPETNRLSKSLYDATMVAISLRPGSATRDIADIRYALDDAWNKPALHSLIVGKGNSSQAIRDRVQLLSAILYGD